MATEDDTAKPTHGRRNQRRRAAEPHITAAESDTALPAEVLGEPPEPPKTLEEAIEAVRTQLLEGRAMSRCLSDVLLYADDVDSVMHADVAQAIARWISDAAEQLDLVKLRPLIDAIRRSGGGSSGGEGPSDYPCRVREPTPVYYG